MEASLKRQSSFQTSTQKPNSLLTFDHTKNSESSYIEPLKLAIFDLDDTLIKPKSHNRYSKNPKDWVFKFDNVVSKLRSLQKNRYMIYIISNQLGIGKGFVSKTDFEAKISSIVGGLGVSVMVLVATQEDEYRKPFTGSYDLILRRHRNHAICKKNSFYVGDAAGRPNDIDNNRIADHSNCDLLFAENAGLRFFTPEMYFQGMPEDYVNIFLEAKRNKLMINRKQFCKEYFIRYPEIVLVINKQKGSFLVSEQKSRYLDTLKNTTQNLHSLGSKHNKKTMILVNGPPHSGKSHLIDLYFSSQNVFSWVS